MPRRPSPVSLGDRLDLEAIELVAGGEALARHEGFPVFVPDLVPGDVALVEIVEAKKGFARGKAIEIRRASRLRRESPCPIADECGGCDWAAIRLEAQLGAKRRILLESLRRTGGFDVEALPDVRLHPSPLNYRIRSRLSVGSDRSGAPAIGFLARRSHQVVPLSPDCEIVGRATLEGLPRINESARGGAGSIQVFEHDGGLEVDSGDAASAEVRLRVPTRIGSTAATFEYRLSSRSFFQVNRHLLGTLVRLVSNHGLACDDRSAALDLYAGAGFFTLPLATIFERVIAVEQSDESRGWAEVNARALPNVKIVGGLVERVLRDESLAAAFVFVDPPRAGLHADAVDAIARLTSEKICYLSCDPVTFSRDAARLARRGWTLTSLDLVDLFPNTHHLETLSAFERDR